MPGSPSRRSVLRRGLAGVSLGVGTAGCSMLGIGGSPKLSLVLLNFTEETRRVYVKLLRTDGRNAEDAAVFDEEYEVPPDRGSDPIEKNAVPADRYLVRVELRNLSDVSDHYHFYPGNCTGDGEPSEELYVECNRYSDDRPNDSYYVTFQQNQC